LNYGDRQRPRPTSTIMGDLSRIQAPIHPALSYPRSPSNDVRGCRRAVPRSACPRVAGSTLRYSSSIFVTSLGWGVNYGAIKILLREWPPLFSRGISGVAAAILLAAVVAAFKESLSVPRRYTVPLLFAAFTNVFAWMGSPPDRSFQRGALVAPFLLA
jgi:hypothetical protein